jgi:hypothetical protein
MQQMPHPLGALEAERPAKISWNRLAVDRPRPAEQGERRPPAWRFNGGASELSRGSYRDPIEIARNRGAREVWCPARP